MPSPYHLRRIFGFRTPSLPCASSRCSSIRDIISPPRIFAASAVGRSSLLTPLQVFAPLRRDFPHSARGVALAEPFLYHVETLPEDPVLPPDHPRFKVLPVFGRELPAEHFAHPPHHGRNVRSPSLGLHEDLEDRAAVGGHRQEVAPLSPTPALVA